MAHAPERIHLHGNQIGRPASLTWILWSSCVLTKLSRTTMPGSSPHHERICKVVSVCTAAGLECCSAHFIQFIIWFHYAKLFVNLHTVNCSWTKSVLLQLVHDMQTSFFEDSLSESFLQNRFVVCARGVHAEWQIGRGYSTRSVPEIYLSIPNRPLNLQCVWAISGATNCSAL